MHTFGTTEWLRLVRHDGECRGEVVSDGGLVTPIGRSPNTGTC